MSEKGFSVVYETTVDALAAYEAQKFRPSEEADERVERLTGCELLILDDLGTEMITEFSKSALYTLVNARLLGGRKTIISTNLTEEDMERLFTPFERIDEKRNRTIEGTGLGMNIVQRTLSMMGSKLAVESE